MKFVIKTLVNLKTRFLYNVIESRITWDRSLNLNNFNDALGEIIYWRDNIDSLHSRNIFRNTTTTDFTVHSDASDKARGVIVDNGMSRHRNLSGEEATKSSTWLELSAVCYGL